MARLHQEKIRLNRDLCPDSFEICVPKESQLFGDWRLEKGWKRHIESLLGRSLPGDDLPDKYKERCCSCDCKPGWKLRGQLALAHAERVHEKLFRQFLRLQNVSAVDVGFAISERETRFWNFLAVRIHVAQKRTPEELFQIGLPSLTQIGFVVGPRGLEGRTKGDWELSRVRTPTLNREQDPAQVDAAAPNLGETQQNERTNCSSQTCRDRSANLRRLVRRARRQGILPARGALGPYPITGIRPEDLSVFCPRSIEETQRLEDVRLCICGVPLDIVNARYTSSVAHPGGDSERGVFVGDPVTSRNLGNDESLSVSRGRVTPMVGGISVGSVTGQAGTLSAVVWDRTDGTPCLLGNWHVLAGRQAAQVGQPTYQPALFDGGTSDDTVGYLKRWHLSEKGDAALSELSGNRLFASGEILGLWHPLSGYLRPKLGLEVKKWGRTTGFTQGFVDGIRLATLIDYGDGVVRCFTDQFRIAPRYVGEDFSRPGDSGSLIVAEFQPQKQQEASEQLKKWLQYACGVDLKRGLCTEIPYVLDRLIKECKTLPHLAPHSKQITGDILSDAWPEWSREDFDRVWKKLNDSAIHDFIKFWDPRCNKVSNRSLKIELKASKVLTKAIQGASGVPSEEQILLELKKGISANRKSFAFRRLNEASEKGFDGLFDRLEGARPKLEQTCRDPENLFLQIAGHRNEFETHCRNLRSLVRRLEHMEHRLERLYEKCRGIRLSLKRVKDRLAKTFGEDWENVESLYPAPEIMEPRYEHQDLCDWIHALLLFTERWLEKARSWSTFCAKIVAEFDKWVKECEHAQKAAEDFEKICRILRLRCDASDGVDPIKLVQCIQDELGKLENKEATTLGCELEDEYDPSSGFGVPFRYNDSFVIDVINDLRVQDASIKRKDVLKAVADRVLSFYAEETDRDQRQTVRAYYAVGMIFAGDTPGSPFGEFAVASDIGALAEELRFSLRPVFEPRSSFRELRERPPGPTETFRDGGSRGGFSPRGTGADPRSTGPQPLLKSVQPDTGNAGGGG